MTHERCYSSYAGVSCRRIKGHDGKHGGQERGSWEHWQWTDDPDDELVTSDWNAFELPKEYFRATQPEGE
jgi:hypothetical protein